MMHKNLPALEACWKLPLRIMLNGIAAVKGLLAGDGGYFFAIARAHRHYVKWVLFDKKKSTFTSIRNRKFTGWYAGCIMWDHFIKKKKVFSEIVGNK